YGTCESEESRSCGRRTRWLELPSGRVPDRYWSEGLHQAVEANEPVSLPVAADEPHVGWTHWRRVVWFVIGSLPHRCEHCGRRRTFRWDHSMGTPRACATA